jgi:hypothetical protein
MSRCFSKNLAFQSLSLPLKIRTQRTGMTKLKEVKGKTKVLEKERL